MLNVRQSVQVKTYCQWQEIDGIFSLHFTDCSLKIKKITPAKIRKFLLYSSYQTILCQFTPLVIKQFFVNSSSTVVTKQLYCMSIPPLVTK